jgi:ribonuclease HI
MKQIVIFCDGSSLGNGTRFAIAGAAAILEFQGKRRIVGEFLGSGTNQQAEIVAAAIGLEALREPCSVTLFTDSNYVVRSMAGGWKRRMNLDFWKRLDAAASPHVVRWQWTKGHAGHHWQEKCDLAARKIALERGVDQTVLDEILTSPASRTSRVLSND